MIHSLKQNVNKRKTSFKKQSVKLKLYSSHYHTKHHAKIPTEKPYSTFRQTKSTPNPPALPLAKNNISDFRSFPLQSQFSNWEHRPDSRGPKLICEKRSEEKTGEKMNILFRQELAPRCFLKKEAPAHQKP